MSLVPYARTRWDEIVPGLWQGGHDYEPTGDSTAWPRDVVVDREFDLVVSMYVLPDSGPAHDIEHVVYFIPDGPLEDFELRGVRRLADRVAAAVAAGRKVLVRCEKGYNRSGLVVGFVLLRQGYSAEQAVRLVRKHRGEHALRNPQFVECISDEFACIVDATGSLGGFVSTQVQQYASNVTGAVIPDSGHWIYEEQPTQITSCSSNSCAESYGGSNVRAGGSCPRGTFLRRRTCSLPNAGP